MATTPKLVIRAVPLAKAVLADDEVRERVRRAAVAGRRLAQQPGHPATRAQRAGTAVREIGGLLSVVGERAEKQRRAQRRSRTVRASLVLGAAAGTGAAIRRRAAHTEPQPAEPVAVPNV